MRRLIAAAIAALSASGAACTSEGPSAASSTTRESPSASSPESSTTVADNEEAATTEPREPTQSMLLRHDGLGPVRVGMSVAAIEDALGEEMVEVGDLNSPGCAIYAPASTGAIEFVVVDGSLAFVQTPVLSTDAGVGPGSSEADIEAAYPDDDVEGFRNRLAIRQVVVRPASGQPHATLFLMTPEGDSVERVKAGSWPAVERFDEGCA